MIVVTAPDVEKESPRATPDNKKLGDACQAAGDEC
jgi:hypothetical protein